MRVRSDSGVADAGVCGCQKVNGVLEMSWECFCARGNCSRQPSATCGPILPVVGCGLRTESFQNIGGINLAVFENGTLVGAHFRDDTPQSFMCPDDVDDSSLWSSSLRGGRFADAGCTQTRTSHLRDTAQLDRCAASSRLRTTAYAAMPVICSPKS